ncbi:hypothetical protein K5549_017949, partial [Capra hircus]
RSAIRISRLGRHTLLNFCLHAALTFSTFAGGINRTRFPTLCQAVSAVFICCQTLSTLLWIGVTARNIYKQVTRKAPLCPGAGQPPYPKQPLLRSYLLPGRPPGWTWSCRRQSNGRDHAQERDSGTSSCWMAWEPSLGAFYGPVAFIALVTCVYFLGTYVQLRRHPERRYELRERTEEQQRLAGPEGGPGTPGAAPPAPDGRAASLLQNEHSFRAQLRAAAFTLFLFAATWAFGALAVSQGNFLDMVFSCLYGAFCVTLGLFVLIHHCAKRDDVWHCWWSCCPARRDPHPVTQASQGHVSCLSPATPCCAQMHCEQLTEEAAHVHAGDAFEHDTHLHTCVQGRTKPNYFSRHRAAAAEQYAYHIPSSLDGSPHSSRSESPPSSLEGPVGPHALACCAQGDPFPLVNQPEGGAPSPVLYSCPPRPGREAARGPARLEMLRRTQSLPF